jgi:cytosine/adenosine deaminase-related metal-dependent hydrolase
MIEWRRGSTPEAMRRHAQANVDASIRLGTTALADITTRGTSWDAIIASPLRGTVYSEVLGLSRGRGLETTEAAFEWLAKVRPTISETDPRLRAGLSPHAPYSTAGWIYQRAAAAHLPLSTHLAELREEVELLALRDGRLRDFFRELGVWDEEWQPLGDRPADYIRKGELRQADWIVAHGNHLEPSDYWQFRPSGAPSGQRVAVAYCPRTHHRFGHATHPYRSMLERDIVVCIGTDSRATAASLSVLDELRFLHRIDPDLRLPLLMAMGTLYGAWGLRLDNVCGSLAPGKAADLAVIPLPDRDESDPHRLIFEHDAPVSSVYIGGELAARGTTPLPLE